MASNPVRYIRKFPCDSFHSKSRCECRGELPESRCHCFVCPSVRNPMWTWRFASSHLPRLGTHVRTGANVVGHFPAFAFGFHNTNWQICGSRSGAQRTRDHLTPFKKTIRLDKVKKSLIVFQINLLPYGLMSWHLKGDDYLDVRCRIQRWLRTWLCGKANPNSLEVERSADGPVLGGYAAL